MLQNFQKMVNFCIITFCFIYRRHNSDVQAVRPAHYHHHHSRTHRTDRTPTKPHRSLLDSMQAEGPAHQESQERRNYYLDLAGIDSSLTKQQNVIKHSDSAPAAMLASPRTPRRSHHHGTPKYRSKSNYAKRTNNYSDNHHSRSRSHDVVQQVLTEQDFEVLDTRFEKTVESKVEHEVAVPGQQMAVRLTQPQEGDAVGSALCTPEKGLPTSPLQPKSASTPKGHKMRPISLPAHIPETVSPHHHRRHRNRERNRKLAMQQVAEWIEREHSSPSWASCGTEHVVIQKHEHHHVHEHHHHHHYHHYQET